MEKKGRVAFSLTDEKQSVGYSTLCSEDSWQEDHLGTKNIRIREDATKTARIIRHLFEFFVLNLILSYLPTLC